MTPKKADRIAKLMMVGHSLDYVCEQGVYYGWSREDARKVIDHHGWSLDWSGRLLARFRPSTNEGMAEAEIDRMLAAGLDHDAVLIRRMAAKAQRAIDELRRALVHQEADDEERAVRKQRERADHDATMLDPERIPHGSWAGYLRHKRLAVPFTPDCGCEQAGNDRVKKAVVASAEARKTPAIAL